MAPPQGSEPHHCKRPLAVWLTAATPKDRRRLLVDAVRSWSAAGGSRLRGRLSRRSGAGSGRRRLRRHTEHPLDVGLHRLQLSTPVVPLVRAVGREVEHAVLAARCDVVLLERLVRAEREALEEL